MKNVKSYGVSLLLIGLMQLPLVVVSAVGNEACFVFNSETGKIGATPGLLKKSRASTDSYKMIAKMIEESYRYEQRKAELIEKNYAKKETLLVAEFPILARFEKNLLGDNFSYTKISDKISIIAHVMIMASEDGTLCPKNKTINTDLFVALILKHNDTKCSHHNPDNVSLETIKDVTRKIHNRKKSGFDRLDSFLSHFISPKQRFDITTSVNQLFTVDWFSVNRPKHVAQNYIPILKREEEQLKLKITQEQNEEDKARLNEELASIEGKRLKQVNALERNMDLKNKVREQEFYLKLLGGEVIDVGEGIRAHHFSADGLINTLKSKNGQVVKITNPKTKESISGIYFKDVNDYVGQNGDNNITLSKILKSLGIVSSEDKDSPVLREFFNFNQTNDNRDSHDVMLFSQMDQDKYKKWVENNSWDHNQSGLVIEKSEWPQLQHNKTVIRRAHMGYKDVAGHMLLKGVNVVHYYNNDYMDTLSKFPTPKNLNDDLEKTYHVIKNKYNLQDSDMIAHGLCLDGGAVSHFGKKHPEVNLILDQTYSSFMDLAKKDMIQNQLKIENKVESYLSKKTHHHFDAIENQIKYPKTFWAFNKVKSVLNKGINGAITLFGNQMFKTWDNTKNLRDRHIKAKVTKEDNSQREGEIGIFFTHQDHLMNQNDIYKLMGESQKMQNMTIWSSPGNHGDKWTKLKSSLSKTQLDRFEGIEVKKVEAENQMKIAYEAGDFEKAGEFQQQVLDFEKEILKKEKIAQGLTSADEKSYFLADQGLNHYLRKIGAYNPILGGTGHYESVRDIDIKRLEKLKDIRLDPASRSIQEKSSYLFKVDDLLSQLESEEGKIVALKETLEKIEGDEQIVPEAKSIKILYFSDKNRGENSDLIKRLIDVGVLKADLFWDGFDKEHHGDGSDRAYFLSVDDKSRYTQLVKDNDYKFQGKLAFEEVKKDSKRPTIGVRQTYSLDKIAKKLIDDNQDVLYMFQ